MGKTSKRHQGKQKMPKNQNSNISVEFSQDESFLLKFAALRESQEPLLIWAGRLLDIIACFPERKDALLTKIYQSQEDSIWSIRLKELVCEGYVSAIKTLVDSGVDFFQVPGLDKAIVLSVARSQFQVTQYLFTLVYQRGGDRKVIHAFLDETDDGNNVLDHLGIKANEGDDWLDFFVKSVVMMIGSVCNLADRELSDKVSSVIAEAAGKINKLDDRAVAQSSIRGAIAKLKAKTLVQAHDDLSVVNDDSSESSEHEIEKRLDFGSDSEHSDSEQDIVSVAAVNDDNNDNESKTVEVALTQDDAIKVEIAQPVRLSINEYIQIKSAWVNACSFDRCTAFSINGAGLSPLYFAGVLGLNDLTEKIQQFGVDPGCSNDKFGDTVCHAIARENGLVAIDLSSDEEATLFLPNKQNLTVAHVALACLNGFAFLTDVCQRYPKLLLTSASNDMFSGLPIHFACFLGNDPGLTTLLSVAKESSYKTEEGVPVLQAMLTATNDNNQTALEYVKSLPDVERNKEMIAELEAVQQLIAPTEPQLHHPEPVPGSIAKSPVPPNNSEVNNEKSVKRWTDLFKDKESQDAPASIYMKAQSGAWLYKKGKQDKPYKGSMTSKVR